MIRTAWPALLLLAAAGFVPAGPAAAEPASAYQRSVAQWRAQHEAQLKADNGWLTVVALDWLEPGENRVGSNPAFEVRLPKSAPDKVGTLTLEGGKVRFRPEKAAGVTMNGAPAREAGLKPDTDPHYDRLAVGRTTFFVIQRDDRMGVRVKDNDSPARKQFSGLKWYPADPAWKITAKFVPYDKPHKVTFETLAGVTEQDESPGYVSFEKGGKPYRLEPVLDGQELWFVMRDRTSGKSTYGASRFLYAPLPKGGVNRPGTVELDFNKAENPPCVFTDFATCPLPPPQNRLPLPVTAGERMYGKPH